MTGLPNLASLTEVAFRPRGWPAESIDPSAPRGQKAVEERADATRWHLLGELNEVPRPDNLRVPCDLFPLCLFSQPCHCAQEDFLSPPCWSALSHNFMSPGRVCACKLGSICPVCALTSSPSPMRMLADLNPAHWWPMCVCFFQCGPHTIRIDPLLWREEVWCVLLCLETQHYFYLSLH